ncbi:MAG: sugar O-acetyltransferase [Ruminococcaceae bacterium]|nr:sugar O-acetyltransferase [Oscillospiraceae bacterium]
MKEWTKMQAGELYWPGDPELKELRDFARSECFRFNHDPSESRIDILKKLFGRAGDGLKVHPTFQCDYGANIHVGDHFFANFDCIILDVCRVEIGDHCMLAPRVCIYTATQSLDYRERIAGKEFGRPVKLGDNVWVGGNAVILPGVTIGDDVVVAAGAVVTKDVPANTIVAGNPARVIRRLN